MEYDKLTGLLHQWKITVVPKESKRIRGYDVDSFRKMAKQTESIDFDCDFSNGNCSGRAMGGNGCCTAQGCSLSLGYWRKEGDTLDEDTVRKIAPFFDEKTGFVRDGEGCSIPRELRSPTCLVVHCSDLMMTDEDKILLARIRYGDRVKTE